MRACACVHGTPDLVRGVAVEPCPSQASRRQRQPTVEGVVVVLPHRCGHMLRTMVHGGRRKVCDVHAARGRHAWHARRARGLAKRHTAAHRRIRERAVRAGQEG